MSKIKFFLADFLCRRSSWEVINKVGCCELMTNKLEATDFINAPVFFVCFQRDSEIKFNTKHGLHLLQSTKLVLDISNRSYPNTKNRSTQNKMGLDKSYQRKAENG